MEYIGDSAFTGNSRLRRVTLNEGLKRIEERAFASTVISTITVPSTVEKLKSNIFYNFSIETINCKFTQAYYESHQSDLWGLVSYEDKINWLNG